MVIETERLLIREFRAEDWEAVHVYASDPLVTRYMIWGPNDKQDTQDYLAAVIETQQHQPRKDYEFAVVYKATGKLIGGSGIHITATGQGEIGYCYNRTYWGQGFASEAAAALLRLGFKEQGLHRIYATCRPVNLGSAKVMQAIGMKYEGQLREHMWHKGLWHDSCLYSILEHEHN
ncbi:GNAT family N-acetyltransferase [Paenibacillus donghaensis]|uniref:GNAT family N-acetyltransferase n=1 Tax=Paenibacillus donghaensis TaxID=414771 RepID=A0A2Z2K871_9BACL|nr:GNAT family protein [Paenibacillus donghaensis]ASA21444.1 GNAT family N-acetyltransferase [Paenibacillus donghaensis]